MSAYREPAPKPLVPRKPIPWHLFYMPFVRVLKIILFIPLKILQFIVYIFNDYIWKPAFGRLVGYIFFGDSNHGAKDTNTGYVVSKNPTIPMHSTNSFYKMEKRHGDGKETEDWWIQFDRTSIFDKILWPNNNFFMEKKNAAIEENNK